jgi:tRNA(Ile)-lysidine synthetase-like protein
LPVALQRRILQEELASLSVETGFERIEQFRLHPGQPMTIEADRILRHDGKGRLIPVRSRDEARKFVKGKGERVVEFHGTRGRGTFGELEWDWRVEKAGNRARFGAGWEWFDADKIGRRMVLRHWRPGDRFQPAGMPGPSKLQDLFTNRKIPRTLRHRLVVATTPAGDLCWVEGLRIAQNYKLEPSTRRRLKWSWVRRPQS